MPNPHDKAIPERQACYAIRQVQRNERAITSRIAWHGGCWRPTPLSLNDPLSEAMMIKASS
ncbi:MAG: hypothetical protein RMN24_03610 [Anaerolineae bacterium]|nr:hypothetical protein [Anaerolineae bacterium]